MHAHVCVYVWVYMLLLALHATITVVADGVNLTTSWGGRCIWPPLPSPTAASHDELTKGTTNAFEVVDLPYGRTLPQIIHSL